MLPRHDEIGAFLRDFDQASVEFLTARGVSPGEMPAGQLEMQWKLLRVLMDQQVSCVVPRRLGWQGKKAGREMKVLRLKNSRVTA
jgi:hypothetical protein